MNSGGVHSDDGERVLVDGNAAADDMRIAAVTRLPERVAQDDYGAPSGLRSSAGRKPRPKNGADTEHVKIIGGGYGAPDAERLTDVGEIHGAGAEGGEASKAVAGGAQVYVIRI